MKRFENVEAYAMLLLGSLDYTVSGLRKKCEEKFPEDGKKIDHLIKNFIQKNERFKNNI